MAGMALPYSPMNVDPMNAYNDASRARQKKQADEDAAAAQARTDTALKQAQAAVSGNNARYTVDANGKVSYTEGANPAAMSALQDLWGSYGGGSSGGNVGSSPQVAAYNPSSNTSAANIAPIAAINTDEAQAAAFARAKDQQGLVARSALTGLSGAMAGRGTVGSGVEGRGQQAIVNAGQQQLGDVIRQQAMTKADLAQQTAEANYSGGITQRGQDLSNLQSQNQNTLAARGQDVTQRGQDIQSSQFSQDLALRQKQQQYAMLQGLMGVGGSY